MITVIGNHISPFVRKVMAVLEVKGLAYQIDSIVPFFGGEAFTKVSPLRRIPVLIDEGTVITDSSVICEYLDERWPDVPVMPRTPAERAKARFLDEYADTVMTDVMLWKVFGRALVAPAIFKAERDKAAIEKTIADDVPRVMDFLETQAPERGFLFGDKPGLADFSAASHAINYRWGARRAFDAGRWPKAVQWIERVEAAQPMQRLNEIGDKILRAPPDGHRPVLEGFGVRVAAETVGGSQARRGPMTVI